MRGFQSNTDDLLRRDIIQQLTCHFRLNKHVIATRWNIDFDTYFASEIEQLAAMVEDGLVAIDDDEIQVERPGRMLVRNICMIFDRYQRSPPEKPTFSRTI